MIGPLLIITGLFWMWVVFKGKSGRMWNAITGDTGFSANLDQIASAIGPLNKTTGNSGNSSNGATVTGNATDSGVHMGIDANGNIITINKSYGNMTPDEKDAANTYAHQIGNVG